MHSFAHRLDRLTDGDFTKAEDFIRLMRVLYTCTLCVSTEKSPTAGQILPIIQKLEKHFAAENGDTVFVADLKKRVWGNLSTRYKVRTEAIKLMKIKNALNTSVPVA